MERRRSLGEYRIIDLTIWAVMLAIFEFIIIMAARFWFPGQPFTVSLAAAVTAIVYMRWSWWGGIHAVIAGAVFCFFSGGSAEQAVIYCVGNLFSMLAVPLLLKVGKEQVRTRFLSLVFPILVLALMQSGRALIALAMGASTGTAVAFFTTDSLSYLFTLVIIWIVGRLDGVYEDQRHYLLRIQAKEE